MGLKITLIISILFIVTFLLLLYPFLYNFLFQIPQKEVIVVGLDGGDYETVKSLIDQNKVPNLRKIILEGTFILYRSNPDVDSYSAWTSIAACNETSLWETLKEKNASFGTLYWPNVTDVGLFKVPDKFEYEKDLPEDIYDSKALLIFKNSVTEFFRKAYWVVKIMFPQNKNEKDLVYEFYSLDRSAREFFYLREKFKPEISFLVLSSPFRIEQYFWMYSHPEKFDNYVTDKEKERYGKIVENYYIELDDFLGKLDKSNKTVIVISNRGVKDNYPPKIVDKINANKILKDMGLLEFDYKDEIDFSKTKAYTLDEGLDQDLKIFITGENSDEIKEELKMAFGDSKSILSHQKIFTVEDFDNGIILKRNISLIIEDERFSISNKTYDFKNFILRRTISAIPEENGFLAINKKVKLPDGMASEDFCKVLLNLIS